MWKTHSLNLVICFLILSTWQLPAQGNLLQETFCETGPLQMDLNLGTGLDTAGNVLQAGLGVVDPYWQLVNRPATLDCTTSELASINGSAYVVNDGINNLWINQLGVSAISPVDAGPTAALNCQNGSNALGLPDPFIFERSFCVKNTVPVLFNLTFAGDDAMYLELIDKSLGSVIATSDNYDNNITAPSPIIFNSLQTLSNGVYAIRVYYFNQGNLGGFTVKGTVAVTNDIPALQNATEVLVAACSIPDTLAVDHYYDYPDSSLTICARPSVLPQGLDFVYQWIAPDGTYLNNAPSSDQDCYTIPMLNEASEGLYYCLVSDTLDLVCFVLPVQVQRFARDPFNTWHIPNQIVVKYSPDITTTQRAEYIASIQGTVIEGCMCLVDLIQLPDTLIDENGVPIIDPEEKKKKARPDDRSGVETVDWNAILEDELLGSRPLPMQQLGKRSKATSSPEFPTEPIKIALIDTGLDYDQAWVQNYAWTNPDFDPNAPDTCENELNLAEIGYDFGDFDRNPVDSFGHGTLVAANMVFLMEKLQGAPPPVQIIPLKVMDEKEIMSLFSVACANLFAIRKEADVINMSIGNTGGYLSIVEEVLNDLAPDQCPPIVLTSAGNNASDNSTVSHYFSNLSDSMANVIAVGAIDSVAAAVQRAGYSNFGANVDLGITGQSFDPNYPGVGTSISAAYASAIMAYIYANKPGIAWSDAKRSMLSTARDMGTSQFANAAGLSLNNTAPVSWITDLDNILGSFQVADNCTSVLNQDCRNMMFVPHGVPSGYYPLRVNVLPGNDAGELVFALDLAEAGTVEWRIFDQNDCLDYKNNLSLPSGSSRVQYNFQGLPNGVYYVQFKKNDEVFLGRILHPGN